MAIMDTSSNKHQKITSLRHLEELIRKEKEDIYYNYLLDSTKEVYDYCSTAELFEENLISIFFTILEKKMIVHDVIEYFVQDFITKNRLIRIFKGSKLFIFINRYLTKSDNDRTISFIFNTLM